MPTSSEYHLTADTPRQQLEIVRDGLRKLWPRHPSYGHARLRGDPPTLPAEGDFIEHPATVREFFELARQLGELLPATVDRVSDGTLQDALRDAVGVPVEQRWWELLRALVPEAWHSQKEPSGETRWSLRRPAYWLTSIIDRLLRAVALATAEPKPAAPAGDVAADKPRKPRWTQAEVDEAVRAYCKKHKGKARDLERQIRQAEGLPHVVAPLVKEARGLFGRNVVVRELDCARALVTKSRPWRATARPLKLIP